ncbi:putative bifunctional diguanylate cyclase/phosphodiesterase [Phascolarctobacterium faecium]
MKNLGKISVIVLFLLSIFVGSFTVYSISKVQSYGTLINYLGIARGATQRLVKLELQQQPHDELIAYIDDIIYDLKNTDGKYGLEKIPNVDYQQQFSALNTLWHRVKSNIYAVRQNPANSPLLLQSSEVHFEIANNTVFAADNYTTSKSHQLTLLSALMLAGIIIMWIALFMVYLRKLYSLESSNKTLYDITTKDPLTGAYNFETFKKKAQKLLTQTTKKYSLSYVDFADFKYINDVFGYKYGDEILINYAATISNELRTGEVLGRVSADNFVILRYYNEKNDIMVRQQQVDIKITEFMHDMYGGQAVSVQCGICYLEDLAEDLQIEGILDRANYARKTVKTGLNRKYAVYDESIRKQLRYEKSIENRMLKSLENEEFLVYFQPKVDLQTGLATQAEALVRWQTDEGLIIPPDKFIPIFEKKYLISSLDQYVFKKVCAFIRRRLDAGLPVNTISVNVSRLQFYNSDFVKTYEDIKNKFRIPDHLLEIEITESIAFDNVTFLEKTVSELKSKGFLISIDDFGTGFSSLSLLKNIPIDVLKIDQSFFRESIHKEKDNIVIKGIIDLVNKLSIQTVAEGIETAEQVAFLKSVNCNMIQGYFFYRPLPEDKFEAILNKEYAVKEIAPAADSKVLAAENWTLQNN